MSLISTAIDVHIRTYWLTSHLTSQELLRPPCGVKQPKRDMKTNLSSYTRPPTIPAELFWRSSSTCWKQADLIPCQERDETIDTILMCVPHEWSSSREAISLGVFIHCRYTNTVQTSETVINQKNKTIFSLSFRLLSLPDSKSCTQQFNNMSLVASIVCHRFPCLCLSIECFFATYSEPPLLFKALAEGNMVFMDPYGTEWC